jgi:hypothetical protein
VHLSSPQQPSILKQTNKQTTPPALSTNPASSSPNLFTWSQGTAPRGSYDSRMGQSSGGSTNGSSRNGQSRPGSMGSMGSMDQPPEQPPSLFPPPQMHAGYPHLGYGYPTYGVDQQHRASIQSVDSDASNTHGSGYSGGGHDSSYGYSYDASLEANGMAGIGPSEPVCSSVAGRIVRYRMIENTRMQYPSCTVSFMYGPLQTALNHQIRMH